MSSNYSAGQFEDAFSPKRLRNWEMPKGHVPKANPKYCSIGFIADENGHLLQNIYRSACSSPWGTLTVTVNAEGKPRSNNAPQSISNEGKKTRLPRFYKKVTSKIEDTPPPQSPTDANNLTIGDILSWLKKLQLPVVWVVGLPTKQILSSRRNFCRELANTLEFTYINLDEQIYNWHTNRHTSNDTHPTDPTTNSTQSNNLPNKFKQVIISPMTHKNRLTKNKVLKNINVCLLKNVTKEASKAISSLSHTKEFVNSKDASSSVSNTNCNKENIDKQAYKISFNLSDCFTREKIIELLLLAMFESLPTNGFVIEGFPYDRAEASMWEKMLYPSALALYFMEGKLKSKTDKNKKGKKNWKQLLGKVKKTKDEDNNKIIPVIPKYVQRIMPYSHSEVERICQTYGHKLIRIINAEDVVFGGMNFLSCLVQKALSQYSNILSGNAKINYESDIEDSQEERYFIPCRSSETEVQKPTSSSTLRLPLAQKSNLTITKKVQQRKKRKVNKPSLELSRSKNLSPAFITSAQSSIPQIPPSSYEYCLPTASLFTIGDTAKDKFDHCFLEADDQPLRPPLKPTERVDNYTPLSWSSGNELMAICLGEAETEVDTNEQTSQQERAPADEKELREFEWSQDEEDEEYYRDQLSTDESVNNFFDNPPLCSPHQLPINADEDNSRVGQTELHQGITLNNKDLTRHYDRGDVSSCHVMMACHTKIENNNNETFANGRMTIEENYKSLYYIYSSRPKPI